jgi:hypothetical protein
MPQPIATYTARVSGLWSTRHELAGEQGRMGVLTVERDAKGVIVRGRYAPEKGEVLVLRRDPGLLRSQFSLWTEGREWLGSSLRWSFVGREIVLSTGAKPYRLLPLPSFRPGWRMVAPKTGEMARILPDGFGRSRIEVYRRVDTELVLFALFLSAQVRGESWWPARADEGESETISSPSKA